MSRGGPNPAGVAIVLAIVSAVALCTCAALWRWLP